jgi:hypothetical protein
MDTQETHSSEHRSSKKKVAATLIAASIFAGQFGFGYGSRQSRYTANYEPIRMKGLSAEEMGTANSRKKSRKQRKRKNRRNK